MARGRKGKDVSRLRREALGILVAAAGAFLLVALWPFAPTAERTPASLNRVGVLGSWTAYGLYEALGFGAPVAAALVVAAGAAVLLDRVGRRVVVLALGTAAAALVGLTLLGVGAAWSADPVPWVARAGALGTALGRGLVALVGVAGAVLACLAILALLAVVVFRISFAAWAAAAGSALARAGRALSGGLASSLARWRAGRAAGPPPEPALEAAPEEPPAETPAVATTAPRSRGPRRPAAAVTAPAGGDGFIPPLDLLEPATAGGGAQSEADLRRLGEVLIEKLSSFQVEGEIVAIHSGPVLTQFEVKPAPGVKVNQIANLADDLALAMRAQRIRIVAPIPGKGAVGIEIPNPEPRMVRIREILESDAWARAGGRIPLALGREIAGAPIVADLARMPHLLIAGATGSGKSVCINAIVTSLLYRYGPDEARLIMIDPKMLELITYNGIPHLLHPVVVEHKESAKALKWTVAEMDRRYRLLAANGVRSLQDFNARVKAGKPIEGPGGEPEEEPRTLPFIVLLIDELADLMLTVQNEIEEPLARLAQMARAVGIHLVLATQRPSVNVITGVIKANFPSRASFQVSSKIDSRTVLDMNGAEALLGNGDMLFLPADRAEPLRVQGAFVTTEETARVVEWLRTASEALGGEEIAPPVDIIAEASQLEIEALDERDELFGAAARVVVENDQGSTSLLQRRLRVGYSRAARILDQLEQAGVVGPPEGTKPREVLISTAELEEFERERL